ncbi:MAG TPA: DUF1566 domain-containing protein [Micavibrio sp.]|nr:DUF1566 domain-containing protein [Micavibrio sp.]
MNVMKMALRTLCAAGLSMLLTTHAYAQCSSPAGAAGEAVFNIDHKVMVYCDNTNWIAMTGGEAALAQPTSGLVAHWTLDETSGSTANDSAGSSDGNYYGGMAPATTNVPGRFDNAQDFDGTSTNYEIEVPDTAAIQDIFDGGGSISMWVYPNSANTAELIYKTTNSGTLPEGYILRFWGAADSRLFFRSPWATGRHEWRTTNSVPLGQWNHIVVTFDNSSDTNEPTIYVNGVSEPFTLHFDIGGGGAAPSDAGVTMWIGWDVDGYMDDVRYYDRELTPAEVTQMYNATSAGGASTMTEVVPSGLVGHWRLDETSGTNAADTSGNGNNGTMNGGLNGGDSVNGTVGTAISFDGAADSIATTLNTDLAQYTISAWVWSPDDPEVCGGGCAEKIIDRDSNFSMNWNHSSTPTGCEHNDGAWSHAQATGLRAQTWYFITCTYDGVDLKIYVDGVEVDSTAVGTPQATASSMIIGDITSSGRTFGGVIDDVRVYNRALSAAEIQELHGARDGVKYNESNNVPQFFDGNRWVSMIGEWPDVTNGLIGHWKLDETTGTVATDATGNMDIGAFASADFTADSVAGAIGRAYNAHGTNSYKAFEDTPYPASYTSSGAFTMAGWVYLKDVAGNSAIISIEDYASLWKAHDQDTLDFQADGWATDGSVRPDTLTIPLGEWVHVAVTYDFNDPVGTRPVFYINGVGETPSTWNVSPSGAYTNPTPGEIGIGRRWDATQSSLKGYIDDIRYYNRELSATEIQTLYKMGAPVGQNSASPQGCPNVGDVCDDGTIYAGLSPDGNVAMYAAKTDVSSGLSWNAGNASGASMVSVSGATCYLGGETGCQTGEQNTLNAVILDSDSATGGSQQHLAARACAGFDAAGAGDWYLPAQEELEMLYDNREVGGFAGTFANTQYWSSSEPNATAIYYYDFGGAGVNNSTKELAYAVRCVRKGPAPRCANPYGLEGQMVYNADNNVMQYCDGARWLAIGKEN